jgi:EpsI family protein
LGKISYTKIGITVLCFILTSIFIYWQPASIAIKKDVSLSQSLAYIKGWKNSGLLPLDQKIIKVLDLDDYTNQNYSNGCETVFLYIGYYLTTKKVGAAHDPLVCFPGQGWLVSNIKEGKFVLNPETAESISYSRMTVQRGLQKEFIIYWFQSYDRTNSDTLSQKITLLWQKIFHKREDNAFVRISISMEKRSLSECSEVIFQFVRAFYPLFLDYIKG